MDIAKSRGKEPNQPCLDRKKYGHGNEHDKNYKGADVDSDILVIAEMKQRRMAKI